MKVTFEFNMILLKGEDTSDEASAKEVVKFERQFRLKGLPPVGAEMVLHGIDYSKTVKAVKFNENYGEDYGWHVILDDDLWRASEERYFREVVTAGQRYDVWKVVPRMKD
jgi:hypothetical protein